MKVSLLNKVESIQAKGEIAHYEPFLLVQQWFEKSSAQEVSESVWDWEHVKVWIR